MKYFRVDYNAYLVDGRCFRPDTWTFLNDVGTPDAARRSVVAETRADARMWHNMEAMITVHRVVEVSAARYAAHRQDVRAVLTMVSHDPDAIRREAARRGELPTVIAEEYKQSAARMRVTLQPTALRSRENTRLGRLARAAQRSHDVGAHHERDERFRQIVVALLGQMREPPML